jgi:hypothetical protein
MNSRPFWEYPRHLGNPASQRPDSCVQCPERQVICDRNIIWGSSQKYWQYARECARWARETKQEDEQELIHPYCSGFPVTVLDAPKIRRVLLWSRTLAGRRLSTRSNDRDLEFQILLKMRSQVDLSLPPRSPKSESRYVARRVARSGAVWTSLLLTSFGPVKHLLPHP